MKGSKHAHTLWYHKPASCWNEALPIGNGRIGGMIYGGVIHEQIDLNEDTLWSGVPYRASGDYCDYYRQARELVLADRHKEAQKLLEQNFGDALVQMYLPLGTLSIDMLEASYDFNNKSIQNYRRELSLNTSLHTVSYTCDSIQYTRKTVASVPHQVIAMEIASDTPASVSLSVGLQGAMSHTHSDFATSFPNDDIIMYLEGNCPVCKAPFGDLYGSLDNQIYGDTDTEKGVGYRAGFCAKANGGQILQENVDGQNRIVVRDADSVVIYFAVRTSFNGPFKHPVLEGAPYRNACLEDLKAATSLGFEKILADSVKEHKRLYDKTELDLGVNELSALPTDERLREHQKAIADGELGDPALYALIFHYGRYLTIAASRKGTQPMNLQGIWNNKLLPPWSSNYTLNINTEMNYWPTLAAGLSECYEPFLRFIRELNISGQHTAKQFYDASGFVSHHASDLWRTTHPTTHRLEGCCQWGFWNMSSGWLACMGMNYYRHTKDASFLKEYFPVLLDAGEFYRSLLIEKDGYMVLCPSTSPENNYMLSTEDGEVACPIDVTTVMTTAIVRDVFAAIVEAGEVLAMLQVDDSGNDDMGDFKTVLDAKVHDISIYQELLKKLQPYSIASDGTLNEWFAEHKEWDIRHRHVSHLYGLFPSSQITSATPELMEACKATLNKREDESSGWSIAWKLNLWARLGDGNRVLKILNRFLVPVANDAEQSCSGGIYSNLFCAHPPFQIDGNFGACSGIMEMLVRNIDGKVELLPALPDAWKNGALYGYHVTNSDVIDLIWKDGKII